MSRSSEQADFWDQRAAAWAREAYGMEAFAQQFGAPAMDELDPVRGQHVADVGCGPLAESWAAAGREARATALDAVRSACDEHRNGDRFRVPATALTVSAAVRP